MDPMQSKWDERYRGRGAGEAAPAAVLSAALSSLHPPGLALDLACGLGANAIALARRGFRVDAWDLSPVAIQSLREVVAREGLAVAAAVRDVIAAPPPPASYDLIVVARFLERRLCPAIAAALRPEGLLLYQTFYGPSTGSGPSDPAFRLGNRELPRLFAGLDLLDYREESATGEAWLIARRGGG
jgi:SAM-dependent methyltransferase